MKDNRYIRITALAAVLTLALGACLVIRAFAPVAVLPVPDVPNMVLLSLVALLAEFHLAGEGKTTLLSAVLSALAFGLLPLASGMAAGMEAVKLAAIGGAVFTLTGLVFDSIRDRLTTGPAAKAAPVLTALGIWLAAQCFAGML